MSYGGLATWQKVEIVAMLIAYDRGLLKWERLSPVVKKKLLQEADTLIFKPKDERPSHHYDPDFLDLVEGIVATWDY